MLCLPCSAGIQYVAPVHEFPEDKWDAIIAIILNSTFHASKAALPYMLDQGWGRIVNTGERARLLCTPGAAEVHLASDTDGEGQTLALFVLQDLELAGVYIYYRESQRYMCKLP